MTRDEVLYSDYNNAHWIVRTVTISRVLGSGRSRSDDNQDKMFVSGFSRMLPKNAQPTA
jgi:hypothetical protein